MRQTRRSWLSQLNPAVGAPIWGVYRLHKLVSLQTVRVHGRLDPSPRDDQGNRRRSAMLQDRRLQRRQERKHKGWKDSPPTGGDPGSRRCFTSRNYSDVEPKHSLFALSACNRHLRLRRRRASIHACRSTRQLHDVVSCHVFAPAAQRGLAADNRQLGAPEFGSILASGRCGMALTVSAVCCS